MVNKDFHKVNDVLNLLSAVIHKSSAKQISPGDPKNPSRDVLRPRNGVPVLKLIRQGAPAAVLPEVVFVYVLAVGRHGSYGIASRRLSACILYTTCRNVVFLDVQNKADINILVSMF